MEKRTISIEDIVANPNLDLSERINMFSKDKRWSSEDLRELAIASIKQDYEFWINNRENVSSKTDAMLNQILNGHILNKYEEFELMCADSEKVKEYSKYEILKDKIIDNNGVSLEDFYELCKTIGFDDKATDSIKNAFVSNGLIIATYNNKDEYLEK